MSEAPMYQVKCAGREELALAGAGAWIHVVKKAISRYTKHIALRIFKRSSYKVLPSPTGHYPLTMNAAKYSSTSPSFSKGATMPTYPSGRTTTIAPCCLSMP